MNVGYHCEGGVIIAGLDDNPTFPHQLPHFRGDKQPSSTIVGETSDNSNVSFPQTCQPSLSTNRSKFKGFCCSESSNLIKVINNHQCLMTVILFLGFIALLTLVWTSQRSAVPQVQQILPPVNKDEPQSGAHVAMILNTNGVHPSQNANVLIPYSNKKKTELEVTLNSPHNLRSVTQVTRSVIVNRLTSEATPSTAGLSVNCCSSVAHLVLQGPISKEWLHHLLKSFQNLETLSIDVDLVVSEWGPNTSGFNLDKVTLIYLHAIYATNSNKSPILEWGFGVELPHLKIMSISKSTFSLTAFKRLQSFLTGSRGTIESIEISESSIGPDCDITELQFPKLKNMKITRVKSWVRDETRK